MIVHPVVQRLAKVRYRITLLLMGQRFRRQPANVGARLEWFRLFRQNRHFKRSFIPANSQVSHLKLCYIV